MLADLKFVQGAVAKKDIIPTLTHFRIKDGFIKGYNGRIALCSPIDIGLNCQPKAVDFIKAIQTCQDNTVHLNMTPAGRLTVKSGKFKAHINCVEEIFPDVEPEGERIVLDGGILQALKLLEPMIAEDASRPWARGILLRDQFAHATNNVVICQYWLKFKIPFDMVIPHDAVNEIIRINEEPVALQVMENAVTFHFSNNRWLRTQTASTEWPAIERVLDKSGVDPKPLYEGFFDDLETLRPFADDLNSCYFHDGFLATHLDEGVGARVEHGSEHIPNGMRFNLNQLRLLSKVATSFDFNQSPALFYGELWRGAIVKMRSE